MTQIISVVFEDAEAWILENLKNMEVDNVAAVYRSGPINLLYGGHTKYTDKEEDSCKDATLEDHVHALKKLCSLIAEKKLFVGGITCPTELTEMENWDVEVTDAYFQLIFHGEVIYG